MLLIFLLITLHVIVTINICGKLLRIAQRPFVPIYTTWSSACWLPFTLSLSGIHRVRWVSSQPVEAMYQGELTFCLRKEVHYKQWARNSYIIEANEKVWWRRRRWRIVALHSFSLSLNQWESCVACFRLKEYIESWLAKTSSKSQHKGMMKSSCGHRERRWQSGLT